MRKIISSLVLLLVVFSSKGQNVGIGTTTPDPSAKLDISDSTKGILIPRMTMAQRNNIQNPAEGLMMYQTDSAKGFWYWDGQNWQNTYVSSSGSIGNSGSQVLYRYGFSSSTNWICPIGVTQITVELWGAGGTSSPGRQCSYNGMPNCTSSTKPGGRGGYNKQTLNVTPGNNYTLVLGLVGQGGQVQGFSSNGGSSIFNSILTAPGGTGAQFNGCSGDMCTPAVNGTDGLVTNYTYIAGPSVTIPSYIPTSGFLSNTSIPLCCAPADINGFIVLSYLK